MKIRVLVSCADMFNLSDPRELKLSFDFENMLIENCKFQAEKNHDEDIDLFVHVYKLDGELGRYEDQKIIDHFETALTETLGSSHKGISITISFNPGSSEIMYFDKGSLDQLRKLSRLLVYCKKTPFYEKDGDDCWPLSFYSSPISDKFYIPAIGKGKIAFVTDIDGTVLLNDQTYAYRETVINETLIHLISELAKNKKLVVHPMTARNRIGANDEIRELLGKNKSSRSEADNDAGSMKSVFKAIKKKFQGCENVSCQFEVNKAWNDRYFTTTKENYRKIDGQFVFFHNPKIWQVITRLKEDEYNDCSTVVLVDDKLMESMPWLVDDSRESIMESVVNAISKMAGRHYREKGFPQDLFKEWLKKEEAFKNNAKRESEDRNNAFNTFFAAFVKYIFKAKGIGLVILQSHSEVLFEPAMDHMVRLCNEIKKNIGEVMSEVPKKSQQNAKSCEYPADGFWYGNENENAVRSPTRKREPQNVKLHQ
jgi:hypothetical protein